jgi:hypothetical protein
MKLCRRVRRVGDDFSEVEYEHEGDEEGRRGRSWSGDEFDNVEGHSVAMGCEQGGFEEHEKGMIKCSGCDQVLVYDEEKEMVSLRREGKRFRKLTHEPRKERDVIS